jgi:ubiquinone/menaquinone biosynthesis C-methylase UbiE
MKSNIYEQKGVYGDESKIVSTSNRLQGMQHIIDSLSILPKRILDIGGGTGYFAHLMKKKYPNSEVVVSDISNIALNIGKTQYKNVKFVLGDAEKKLPFKSNYFDLIISGEHIEHLVDVDSYLEELNRVSKRGGYLLLTTPNLGSWINRILLLLGLQPWYLEGSYRKNLPIFSYKSFTFPENPNGPAVGHLRLYTLNMLKKLLKEYGFSTVSVIGSNFMVKPVIKQIDLFFSKIPSMAFGITLLCKKL